ncbi:MAG: SRPBCC family protein [Gammaproteobacteria bacterium]|nr:SRPBCC family protein [Gammaproteobacteria bacterium]
MPKVYNSIVVNAPVEIVWKRIADFHDFSWAPSVITTCEKVGIKDGTAVGAQRLLNGAFLDTLIAYSALEHRIMYSIDDAPSPISPSEISGYVGNLHLLPVTSGNRTFAEWTGTWESTGTEAVSFMNDIYRALLRDLGQQFE